MVATTSLDDRNQVRFLPVVILMVQHTNADQRVTNRLFDGPDPTDELYYKLVAGKNMKPGEKQLNGE